MDTSFRRVETGAMRRISEDKAADSSPPELSVVPDLTGDKIPDFFEVKNVGRHSPGHENDEGFDAGACTMLLTKGAYGKDGNLVKSGSPIVLASQQWSTTERSITDVQFADYNADGIMDISFWQFTNREEGFRQVILFGQKS